MTALSRLARRIERIEAQRPPVVTRPDLRLVDLICEELDHDGKQWRALIPAAVRLADILNDAPGALLFPMTHDELGEALAALKRGDIVIKTLYYPGSRPPRDTRTGAPELTARPGDFGPMFDLARRINRALYLFYRQGGGPVGQTLDEVADVLRVAAAYAVTT